jgi:RNA polymerase sigma-70 factor (ECF subfamily)
MSEPLSGFADQESFARFYRQTAPALRRYVTKLVNHGSVADDILQTAYCRMLRNAPVDPGHQRAYLYKVAGTIVIDRARMLRRSQAFETDLCVVQPASAGADHASELRHLMRHLTTRDWSLLWLAYAEGFDHDEIAAITGLASKSVRVLLSRARERAKALLQDNGREGTE